MRRCKYFHVWKKMKEKAGESLIETLAALLITCMGLVLLPGAIVAAARVNKAAEDSYLFMDAEKGTSEDIDLSLWISDGGAGKKEIEVQGKKDTDNRDTDGKHSYFYYRLSSPEPSPEEP